MSDIDLPEAEILFEVKGAAGVVTLNRPKALNALTLNMVRALDPQLRQWAEDPSVERIIVKGAGEKGFCAGGDIRALYDWGTTGDPLAVGFYEEEYKLNTFIKEYPKPYIALLDGITMGGGVGLSVHGSHRIATERLMFAMPETGIGLFPDVGGTYFLPRTPGETGMWLSLTGARLKAADALFSGIAKNLRPIKDNSGSHFRKKSSTQVGLQQFDVGNSTIILILVTKQNLYEAISNTMRKIQT